MPRPASKADERGRRDVHHIEWWRGLLLFPLAGLLRLWCLTLRFHLSERDRDTMLNTPGPVVFLLWHNRLFVAAEVYRRLRRGYQVSGLISASKDGAWLSAFFSLMGIGTVRGSRNYRGTQALRELAAHVKRGGDIAITPDGSRGPIYEMKPGALLPARLAGTVIIVSCRFSRYRRLSSWDRFYIPMPFSSVYLRCEYFNYAEIKKAHPTTEDQTRFFEDRLNTLAEFS
ncbi:MAG: lysophospholipid acyltransferase family protein [Opitutales bacterium]|nr:lysophospholipid acyltransferase family protein [Opitutales bacterium]NRA26957.1 lysophospholipid acyltransferase family protein [Opitutales bacterium]